MSSKFFSRGSSDEDESSSDYSSSDESIEESKQAAPSNAAAAKSRREQVSKSSVKPRAAPLPSDDDDESSDASHDDDHDDRTERKTASKKKIVRKKTSSKDTAADKSSDSDIVRDKKWDALNSVEKSIRNHSKINDFVSLQKDFDLLQKNLDKYRTLVSKEGIPNVYYHSLLLLSDKSNAVFADKEKFKSLKGDHAKALQKLRQNVKKAIQQHDTAIQQYKQSPEYEKLQQQSTATATSATADHVASDEDESEGADSASEDEGDAEEDGTDKKSSPFRAVPVKKPVKKKAVVSDDDSEYSSDESDEDESTSEEESDEEEGARRRLAASARRKKAVSSDEDESEVSSSEEESEAIESESDEEEEEELDLRVARPDSRVFTREFWVKSAAQMKSDARRREKEEESDYESSEAESDEDDKEKIRKQLREQRARVKAEQLKKQQEAVAKQQAAAVAEGQKVEHITPELIVKRLKELISIRGRRGTDRHDFINAVEDLKSKADTLYNNQLFARQEGKTLPTTDPTTGKPIGVLHASTLIKICITYISALFDAHISAAKDSYMSQSSWLNAYEALYDILDKLQKAPNVRLTEDDEIHEEHWDTTAPEGEPTAAATASASPSAAAPNGDTSITQATPSSNIEYVSGNVLSWVKILYEQYRKSLLSIDRHSNEYIRRFKDEGILVKIVERAAEYYKSLDKNRLQAKCLLIQLDLVYYHYHPELDALNAIDPHTSASNDAIPAASTGGSEQLNGDASQSVAKRSKLPPIDANLVKNLADTIVHYSDSKSRVRALLYYISHKAIHNYWQEAKDLLLGSHVSEHINEADIKTRILYNRAMAYAGMCAFKAGDHRSALYCLADLFAATHVRELLAQGKTWQNENATPEDQVAERKRLLPYHMHINLDTLEAIHLLSAMLVEVPNVAINGRKKLVSKAFRRMYDHHQRQSFTGPPENTRDIVMAATKSLHRGDWKASLTYVQKLRAWNLIPHSKYVYELYEVRVREEALRVWLCTYGHHYATVSLESLANMFNLDTGRVKKLASKLMMNEVLQGGFSERDAAIVMQAQNVNQLQRAALNYSDKVAVFVDINERMFDHRSKGAVYNANFDAVQIAERDAARQERRHRGDFQHGQREHGHGRRGGRGGRGGGDRGGGGDRRRQ